MAMPNFFIVGKPKAGTTSLHSMLSHHPDIFMSPVKEPHHFHRDYIEEAEQRHRGNFSLPYKDRKQYLKLFECAKNERIVGESSTGYIYSKKAAKEIADFNPDAKILVIFREPVSFLYSLHSQFLRSGVEIENSFKKALLLEKQRRSGISLPEKTSFTKNLLYSEQTKYCEQLERFNRVFCQSQIKVKIYEDFREDYVSFYRDILDFLGVNTDFLPELVRNNPHKNVRFVKVANWLIYHGERKKNNIVRLFPDFITQITRPILSRLFFKASRRNPIDPELRMELMQKFKSEVVNFSETIGTDLVKKWGYDNI